MNKAVIFDLDGVIVDTAKYHFKALFAVAFIGLDVEFPGCALSKTNAT